MLCLAALIVGVTAYVWPRGEPSDAETLAAAQTALRDGRYAEAEELASGVLQRDSESRTARRIAFEAALQARRLEPAFEHFGKLPGDLRAPHLNTLIEWGSESVDAGRVSAAERLFRMVLAIDPGHVVANDRVASLLAMQGRHEETEPFVRELIRQSRCTPGHLLFLSYQHTDFQLPSLTAKRELPDDAGAHLAAGMMALERKATDEANRNLREAVRLDPDLREAWVRLGQISLDSGDGPGFQDWWTRLPEKHRDSAGIWRLRGLWAVQQGRPEGAARCFWEAGRRNPDDLTVNSRLAGLLASIGDGTNAEAFESRAALLRSLSLVSRQINDDRSLAEPMEQAAELCEKLGRPWEAAGWWLLVSQRRRDDGRAREELVRLQSKLQESPDAEFAAANPARQIDLSRFPPPELPGGTVRPTPKHPSATGRSHVAFRDRAAETGLRFRYESGMLEKIGMRMYEFTGGGIGVIDFDGDGWPDVVFTQGGTLIPEKDQPPDAVRPIHNDGDRLFRNLGGERFEDVTEFAGLGGKLYGQGVAVGDFDNDGFPDLLVANIGENRLYRNNGDGTFTDATQSAGLSGERWSTSCTIADVDGDGLPDLYVVNYLSDPEEYKKVCHWIQDGSRKPPNCSPDRFAAEQDRLYRNLGDGRFEDVTATSGIMLPNGKGLGIVAADFDRSGKLSLFVANDGEPNFYFVRDASPGDSKRLFRDAAVAAGLAVDRDGETQACMGVAVDDADGNGLLDLFITNFYRQSNTLYQQEAAGQFIDATRPAGLRDPSYDLLGFGAQFLDAELDGLPDLVLTNGHVTDVSHVDSSIPYRMRSQFFRNLGGGRFRELRDPPLGRYFERKVIGRALARLDWNRDGRDDFAVLHLDSDVALLTNETKSTGRFLAVQLSGTKSPRDAVGTRVVVEAGGKRWEKQLTAGDGYQVSNHRQIIFGLGERETIDALTVHWISGRTQQFANLPVDREILLIEGRPEPIHRSPR
jgi:tetratricopeptide (TPR) repeat protein